MTVSLLLVENCDCAVAAVLYYILLASFVAGAKSSRTLMRFL